MKIKAVFFDLGGVILRTEDPEPRTKLAESLGLTYSEIDRMVFENESSRKASLGFINETQHWINVAESLNQPLSEVDRIRDQFFAGDVIDANLLSLIRSIRPTRKVGVISNAWSGMRGWMDAQNIGDAFDDMVISAEVGSAKPDPLIYQVALQNLQVEPDESVFLDDLLRNIEAARKVGMHAIHFLDPDQAVAELKDLLKE